MNDEHRPDPDALLAAIQRQEAREERGRLKVFFGMAAGVGKTDTMLQAGHEDGRRKEQDLSPGRWIIRRQRVFFKGQARKPSQQPAAK